MCWGVFLSLFFSVCNLCVCAMCICLVFFSFFLYFSYVFIRVSVCKNIVIHSKIKIYIKVQKKAYLGGLL